MVPASALLGASFLLLMDDIARSLTGAEIPISIITALLGAPFFAYLLISQKNSGWNR
jgi:iron complex transport system permease protein